MYPSLIIKIKVKNSKRPSLLIFWIMYQKVVAFLSVQIPPPIVCLMKDRLVCMKLNLWLFSIMMNWFSFAKLSMKNLVARWLWLFVEKWIMSGNKFKLGLISCLSWRMKRDLNCKELLLKLWGFLMKKLNNFRKIHMKNWKRRSKSMIKNLLRLRRRNIKNSKRTFSLWK